MKQRKRIPWGQVIGTGLSLAMGVGCGVVLTSWFDRCPAGVSRPLWALGLAAAFLLALLAQITLHEGGHLVCGLLSGYRFCSFRVGSLMWMKVDGHLRLRRLRLPGTGGQCLMSPPDMVDGRLPVTLYNFGGALANLLTAALALALYGPARRVPLLAAFLLFLAVIGGFTAAMNGIPLRLGNIDNDGRNALSLGRDPAALRAFWVQMKVAEAQARGLRLREMPEDWFSMPGDEALQNAMTAAQGVLVCNRLVDEGRLAEAEQVLCIVNTRKRAQQVYERLPEEGRFHLSTLMIPTDREETLNVIRARLRNGQVCRVVSTSLVEAGVDVDFPSVWRELAGLDSILQAAGRCNREGKRSAAESVVHVFDAEGDPPLSMMQQREAAMEVMGEFEEINTRPAIRAYFNRLLWVKGDDALDAKRILNSERACTFRKTAEAFRLIDADTCTVYVPNEGNAEDIAQLRAGLYSRALIRRLGRSSVNVYQNEYKNLVFAGIVEDHQEDGFGILIQPDAYKPKCGLSTEVGDGFLSK